MSGPITNVNASNDPFGGGNLQRAGRPDQGPTGGLGGFVSSGRPPAVTPAAVRNARNYRGTNATIPYARVVPLVGKEKNTIFSHPKWQNTDSQQRPIEPGVLHDPNDPNGSPAQWMGRSMNTPTIGYSGPITLKDHMQYELLNAADIAFILKHRPGSMPPGQYLNQSTIGGVGAGVDRMQKLCSFEWLQLYIYYKFMRDNNVITSSASATSPYLIGGGRPTNDPPVRNAAANYLPNTPDPNGLYSGKVLDKNEVKDYWAIGGWLVSGARREGTLVGVYHAKNAAFDTAQAPLLVNNMPFQEWIAANFQPPVHRFLTTGNRGNYGGVPFFSESALMLGEDDWFASNDLIHRVIWHQLMLSEHLTTLMNAGAATSFAKDNVELIRAFRRPVYGIDGGEGQHGYLEIMLLDAAGAPMKVEQQTRSPDDTTRMYLLQKDESALAESALYNIISASFSCLCASIDPLAMACFPSPLFATSGWSYVEDHRLEEQLERAGLFDWVPDGVVINKLYGGDSPFVDGLVQADMGQLYNIAVQGSAVCKSFKSLAYDMQHKTQPRDDMFVTLSAVSECNLILVGMKAEEWDTDAETTLKKCDDNLGLAFVAEMANVLVSSGPGSVQDTMQITGSYTGRHTKAQKLGLTDALPGRYNIVSRKREVDIDLSGARAGAEAAQSNTLKFMRRAAGHRDAGAKTEQQLIADVSAEADESSCFLSAFLNSGKHNGTMLETDQAWRFPGVPGTDTENRATILYDVEENKCSHHVGCVIQKAISALVMVGSQTNARLKVAMQTDLTCEKMFGCALKILKDKTPIERITPDMFNDVAYAGTILKEIAGAEPEGSSELERARVAVHNARQAYYTADMIAVDMGAKAAQAGQKTRKSALHHRVRAIRHAIMDFEATVRRLLPSLNFRSHEYPLVNGGEIVFLSTHNEAAVKESIKNTFGVDEKGRPDEFATGSGDTYKDLEFYKAGCVNAALWQHDIDTVFKEHGPSEARLIIMGWYRILVLAGLAVPSDCKISDARLELMGSQQMSQHNCYVTDHLEKGFFERKPAFKPFEGSNGNNFFGSTNGGTDALAQFSQRMIVGAWKIGSVLDSAASPIVAQMPTDYMNQSAMHSSNVFADNLNVAIEWWPASKLANSFARKANSRSQGFRTKSKIVPNTPTSFSVSMESALYQRSR